MREELKRLLARSNIRDPKLIEEILELIKENNETN
jgi:hypothetical protein